MIFDQKQTYSCHCQIPSMKLFPEIVHGFQPLTVFAKSFILDVWGGSEHTSEKVAQDLLNSLAMRFIRSNRLKVFYDMKCSIM